ncbi:UNVERIFIED_CONTAM: hypothetical protein Sradi_5112200 [Sesamum radiatum]|uniref:Reverse transcriptase zinc-binding domain-containing protein n=1 Tax=Sesamum radiatum TaxID=300843 RepID=A0AAW2M1P8_SESRA
MKEAYARCRQVDTDCILSIRLKAKGTTNKLVWHFDCNGLFSVKSAYKLATTATDPRPSSTNMSFSLDGAASWRSVWGSLVVPKVQLFTWRSCANAIPTLENLRRKGVDVDGGCPNCGEEAEDLHHALHSSSFARLVWELSKIPLARITWTNNIIERWFRLVRNKLDEQEPELFLIMCWALWKNRNKKLFDGHATQAYEVISMARWFLWILVKQTVQLEAIR